MVGTIHLNELSLRLTYTCIYLQHGLYPTRYDIILRLPALCSGRVVYSTCTTHELENKRRPMPFDFDALSLSFDFFFSERAKNTHHAVSSNLQALIKLYLRILESLDN